MKPITLTPKTTLLILGLAVALIAAYVFMPAAGLFMVLADVTTGPVVDISGQLKRMREERSAEIAKMDAIALKTTTEKRSRNDQEKTDWEASQKKIDDLDTEIRALERLEEQRSKLAKEQGTNILKTEALGDNLPKVSRRYSIAKALRDAWNGKLTGLEAEMDQEAAKEGRILDSKKAGFSIPSALFAIGKERRDLTITTEGADVMQTDLSDQIIPILAPKPVVADLGATVITGLQGDFQFRRHNGAASMAWQGEGVALTETTPTFDNVKLQPKSLGGFTEVSDQFFVQAPRIGESWVRTELERSFALKLDLDSLSGSGAGSVPTGVANTAGIGTVSFGTPNGGAPSWAAILEFISDVEIANALMGSIAFLSTPNAKAKLMNTPKQSSGVEGNFILNPATPGELAGYRFVASNQARNNLVEGTSGATLSEMFFGNWAELMIGQFGAINVLINPYIKSRERLVSIEISSLFDIKLAHAASFSYAADMITV